MESAIGALNDIKATSTALFEANLGVQQSNLAFQRQKEMAQFESNLDLQKSQAEFNQKLAQQAQLASDPISGTNAIIDTFEKMGIMADRSRQEIVADIQNKVASGVPLGKALSELQTAFKSKPLYQSMVANQMASLQPKAMEY